MAVNLKNSNDIEIEQTNNDVVLKLSQTIMSQFNKIATLEDELEEVRTPGRISIYAGATAPNGWLVCDGSTISRTTYADLFNVIGTTYGNGDGSTTFNLPNLKGRVPVGQDITDSDFDTLGETGGEKKHTLTVNEMPEHFHKIGNEGAILYGGNRAYFSSSGSIATWANSEAHSNTNSEGGGQAHNNLQPYIVLNYIIKY